jgi:2'-5' RNA ligase
MRLFVGIALSDAVVLELSCVVARLRSGSVGGGLRWTEPESWHITLEFLGGTSPEQHACLLQRLGEIRHAPVRVELGELGCFERTGVFFAEVAATPGLAALAKRVSVATGHCGFKAEARPFHPHITLARAKGPGRGAGVRALDSGMRRQPAFKSFTAHEFLLYESHLSTAGSRYEVRARFPLVGL